MVTSREAVPIMIDRASQSELRVEFADHSKSQCTLGTMFLEMTFPAGELSHSYLVNSGGVQFELKVWQLGDVSVLLLLFL